MIPEQPTEANLQPVLSELVYCKTWGSSHTVWRDQLEALTLEAEQGQWHLAVSLNDWPLGKVLPALKFVAFVYDTNEKHVGFDFVLNR